MAGGLGRPGLHLTVAGVLVLGAAAVLAWSAFNSGDRYYLAFAVLLVAASVGLFMRQRWAKYVVFVFAAASVVWWLVAVWYSWWREGQTVLVMLMSLAPGVIWCAFWLSLCLTVQRGFEAEHKAVSSG